MKPFLLYLHGFNSSASSAKAAVLREYLKSEGSDIDLAVPQLHHDPRHAMEQAQTLVEEALARKQPVGLMGSSLGGFYAAALSTRFDLPAVMINPAVYPYRLLADYLGPQENPYTGERYHLTEVHRDALYALDTGDSYRPGRLFMLMETRDETLDFREALNRFPGARTWIRPGGSHAFEGYRACLPAALDFLFGVSRFPDF